MRHTKSSWASALTLRSCGVVEEDVDEEEDDGAGTKAAALFPSVEEEDEEDCAGTEAAALFS